MDIASYKHLQVELENRVLTVTINNPEMRNVMTDDMREDFRRVWTEVSDDLDIGAIILTAVGDRTFNAGGNVKAMKSHVEQTGNGWRGSYGGVIRGLQSLIDVEQPIICAVNGDAYGWGCSIAFCCDIIVANEKARFADTHVKVGLVAADGGVLTWPLMMGMQKAKEYLLTGDPLLAKDAERLGIINYAVPYEEVMPKAREIATRLANGAPWAIRWTKSAVNKILKERLNLLVDTAAASEWLTFMTEDHKEAATAFGERRQPVFKGR